MINAYADVIVKIGVNLRPGQCFLINTGAGTYDFARTVAESAYRHGAKFVRIVVSDNHLIKYRIANAKSPEELDWLPNYVTGESYEYLANDWARIRIDSTEELEVLKDSDPSLLGRVQSAQRATLKRAQEELMRDQHPWCVVAAPGPKWARWIFRNSGNPELSKLADTLRDEELTAKLWDIFKGILRLDKPDPAQAWLDHMAMLGERSRKLDSLHLDGLRFRNKETDLFIGLLANGLWRGGNGTLPDGRSFLANIPTEEVYTTPDYRRTTGRVKATRPVNVMETLVRDAWFEFEKGKIVNCGATVGDAVLKNFVKLDEGASYLGEVALVAGDSPIFQSGLLFGSILYDENASCHIAVGAGYPSCLSNAAQLSSQAAVKAAGCNVSMVHTDFMIGSPETDVLGVTKEGREIPIITQGRFVI